MKITNRFRRFFLCACISVSVHAMEDIPIDEGEYLGELIATVEQHVIDDLAESNYDQLQKRLYFSKRHVIAKLDAGLLFTGKGVISLTPFENLSVMIAGKGIDYSPKGYSSFWKGSVVFPDGEERFKNLDKSVVKAIKNKFKYFKLLISHAYLPDGGIEGPSQGEVESVGVPPSVEIDALVPSVNQTNNRRFNHLKREGVPTIYGKIYSSSRKRIIIVPLNNNPEYHLIYEEDDRKTLKQGRGKEAKERRDKYLKFLEKHKL